MKSMVLGTSIVLIFCLNSTLGQENSGRRKEQSRWPYRYDLFQMLFEQQGLKPIGDWRLASKQPEATVVVALGDVPQFNESLDLYRFQRRGGAVLIATDHSYHLRADLSISRGPISTFSKDDQYQGHHDCIRIKNLNSSHLLAAGIAELITNRTGVIRPRWSARSKWQVIARLPNSTKNRSARGQPIVAALDREKENGSRFVVVSDHSLFTNGTIWHGDNARFAINVASFLGGESRSQVLFLVDGIAASSYLVGPLAGELPFPDTGTGDILDLEASQMADVANSVIEHVVDTNVINELATDQPRNLREPIFRRVLWNVLALGLFVVAVVRLARRGQKPSEPANSRLPRSTSYAVAKPRNDLESHGLTAASLARTLFREATGSTDPVVWKELVEQDNLQSKPLELPQESKAELALMLSLALETKPAKMANSKLIRIAQSISNLRQQLSETAARI